MKFKVGDRVIYVGSVHRRLIGAHGTVTSTKVETFEGTRIGWTDDSGGQWTAKGVDLASEEEWKWRKTGGS